MPTVEFEAAGPATTISLPDGGRMIDACDEAGAPVEFSCRSASCATCRVEVLAGAELLDPPGEDELEVLELLGVKGSHRLACQAVIRPGEGLVTLRWAAD